MNTIRRPVTWFIASMMWIGGCGSDEVGINERWQSQLTGGGEAITNGGLEVVTDAQGRVLSKQNRRLTPTNVSVLSVSPKPSAPVRDLALPEKVQGKLRGLIDNAGKADPLAVAVAIKDMSRLSPLPGLDESLPRDAAVNVAKLAERQAAFDAMATPRRQVLRRWTERIRAAGGEVLGEYVVGSTVVAQLPAGAIDALAGDAEIEQIASRWGEQPPADGSSLNDAIDARALVGTDPFVNAGYTGNWGWVGLLDTGVRSSHVMLQVPSPFSLEADCYRGGASCLDVGAPGYNTTDTYGHGTSSAAIIAGTSNLGAAWRGVTAQQGIDSWKISDDLGGSDVNAVLRAYDRARVWSDWAVAATIQVLQAPNGSVSAGANDLYDLGIAVFASNGNFTGTARAPANANKAMGVGGYDVVSGANFNAASGTPDGRFKPDLRTPTNVETASAKTTAGAVCDSCMKVYGGTSCAAPMAVGTASLLRHYFFNNSLPSGPGNLYAGLIAFGNELPNATNGSGKTRLAGPTCSRYSVGEVTLTSGQIVELPVTLGEGESNLKAAIWWPTQYQSHRDIDLHAFNPSGGFVAGSNGVPSVFERVQVDGALQSGTWKIRITGYSIPIGSQQVFYVIYNKSC